MELIFDNLVHKGKPVKVETTITEEDLKGITQMAASAANRLKAVFGEK